MIITVVSAFKAKNIYYLVCSEVGVREEKWKGRERKGREGKRRGGEGREDEGVREGREGKEKEGGRMQKEKQRKNHRMLIKWVMATYKFIFIVSPPL